MQWCETETNGGLASSGAQNLGLRLGVNLDLGSSDQCFGLEEVFAHRPDAPGQPHKETVLNFKDAFAGGDVLVEAQPRHFTLLVRFRRIAVQEQFLDDIAFLIHGRQLVVLLLVVLGGAALGIGLPDLLLRQTLRGPNGERNIQASRRKLGADVVADGLEAAIQDEGVRG